MATRTGSETRWFFCVESAETHVREPYSASNKVQKNSKQNFSNLKKTSRKHHINPHILISGPVEKLTTLGLQFTLSLHLQSWHRLPFIQRIQFLCTTRGSWASSIAVRALAYCAEDHGSRPTFNQWLDVRSLPTQQRMGPGRNTGEIKAARKVTDHPTSQNRWLRTSVLSNRHSPTHGSYMGLTFTLLADRPL